MDGTFTNDYGARVPIINLLNSVIALAILCLLLKSDNDGTLLTQTPLEGLFLPPINEEWLQDQFPDIFDFFRPEAPLSKRVKLGRKVGRSMLLTLVIFLLQILRSARSVLSPGMSVLAAAMINGVTQDALSIVLNSVAVGCALPQESFCPRIRKVSYGS